MKRRADGKDKVIEVNMTKAIGALCILLMCVLMVIGAVRFVRSLMEVSEFEIVGDSPYEREEIISASGIRYEDKLYKIDTQKAIENIKRKCPYIDKVIIESKFPGKVKIDVSSLSAYWYAEIAGDYYALDSELRVLEEVADNTKFINGSVPKLTLPNIKSAVVGQTLIYGDNDAEVRFAEEFISMVMKTTFKSRLTLVDIENRFEIFIQVDGSVNVYMGGTSDTKVKLDAVEKALSDPVIAECVSAEIDVSNPAMISVRPSYAYDDPTQNDDQSSNE